MVKATNKTNAHAADDERVDSEPTNRQTVSQRLSVESANDHDNSNDDEPQESDSEVDAKHHTVISA